MKRSDEQQIDEFEAFLVEIETKRKQQENLYKELNIKAKELKREREEFEKKLNTSEDEAIAKFDKAMKGQGPPPTVTIGENSKSKLYSGPLPFVMLTASEAMDTLDEAMKNELTIDEMFVKCENLMENLNDRMNCGFPLVKNFEEQKCLFKMVNDHEGYFRDTLSSATNILMIRWSGLFKKRFGYRCEKCRDVNAFFEAKLKHEFSDQADEIKFIKDKSNYCQVCGIGLYWFNKSMKATMHTFDNDAYDPSDLDLD